MHLRRTNHELRVEFTPLVDVIFLLLTFFIYSMMLMVRAETLPLELREFQSSTPAKPQPTAVISIDLEGKLYLGRTPITLEELLPGLAERRAEEPEVVVYLIVADGASSVDRAPLLQDIWDRLKNTGLEINLVGRPKSTPPAEGGSS